MNNFEEMINTIQLGDCYELIKKIPDKSIDLVYTDVPYLYVQGGGGSSELSKSVTKKRMQLIGLNEKHIDSLLSNKTTSEALRIAKNTARKSIDITDIESGFDYKLLDELCRVMKHIYIYIFGVVNYKY